MSAQTLDFNNIATDSRTAKRYCIDRRNDFKKLHKELIASQGNLPYVRVRLMRSNKAVVVGTQWCANLTCAIAYILKCWW